MESVRVIVRTRQLLGSTTEVLQRRFDANGSHGFDANGSHGTWSANGSRGTWSTRFGARHEQRLSRRRRTCRRAEAQKC